MPRGKPPTWMFCCDPGLVSGIAILRWSPETGIQLVSSSEESMLDVGIAARGFLRSHPWGSSEIVVERFTITEQTAKNSQAPWSLKVCGVIEFFVYDVWNLNPESAVRYQSPADAKTLVPNEILRRAELWHRGGAGHARDAIRHGVYRYATQHGVRDAWLTERRSSASS